MQRLILGLLVAAVVAVAVVGCGGPSAAERAAKRKVNIDQLASALRSREFQEQRTAERAAQRAAHARCQRQLGKFLSALRELDSRLNVGLIFSAYSDRVGDIRVAYNELLIDVLRSQPLCFKAAISGESALNSYVKAYNTWNACIKDAHCPANSIDSKLQDAWAKASDKLRQAETQLKAISSQPVKTGIDVGAWTTRIPGTAAEVSHTVYGAAEREFCGKKVSVETAQPCHELRMILVGGVSSKEIRKLDATIAALNDAYGFVPGAVSGS